MIYNPVRAIIKITYSNISIARLIFNSIQPDNIDLPSYIKIQSIIKDNNLVFKIRSWKGLGSLLYTVDDILQCISSAEKLKDTISSLNS